MAQLVEQREFDPPAERNIAQRIKLISVKELLELPPPEWLIDGIMERGAFAVLYGPSGEGKTFLALDWFLCIAASRKWAGRDVTGKAVVYVVAEGTRNIGSRIAAWMQEHNVDDLQKMFAVLQAVEITKPDCLKALQDAINEREISPGLIVIDTLARCFGTGDENSAKDMGQFIRACDQLREATGATVLAVHHTGKGLNGGTERGSSALRGAADAMIQVSRKDGTIWVKVDKQKDGELIKAIPMRLEQVTVRNMANQQRSRLTSAVLVASDTDRLDGGAGIGAAPMQGLKALVTRAQTGRNRAGSLPRR